MDASRLTDRSLDELVEAAVARGRHSVRGRVARVSGKSWHIGQCAVAAGLAWFVAKDLFHHQVPFFAPIVAVVCLGTTYGQRLRRVVEVTVGVALGVFIADLFVKVVGGGAWQITVIVAAAMAAALFLDAGGFLVTQAALQGIFVATLLPRDEAVFTRWTDALIGGAVALLAAAVVPQAPLRQPRVQAAVVVRAIACLLREAAAAVGQGDVGRAAQALADARATEPLIRELHGAADEGLSVLASSPLHRHHAVQVRKVADLIDPIDRALRSTRVLIRRVVVATRSDGPVPASYVAVLTDLAAATDILARALGENASPEVGRSELVRVGERTAGLVRTSYLSTEVLLAQLRSTVIDLLQVTGLSVDEALSVVPPVVDRPT
ncbi:MAG TPA: FUSC family protein [Candidatus Lustribacter sp.]|nr:FUSC family protein [Candidatus Lustribacter sp.]